LDIRLTSDNRTIQETLCGETGMIALSGEPKFVTSGLLARNSCPSRDDLEWELPFLAMKTHPSLGCETQVIILTKLPVIRTFAH